MQSRGMSLSVLLGDPARDAVIWYTGRGEE